MVIFIDDIFFVTLFLWQFPLQAAESPYDIVNRDDSANNDTFAEMLSLAEVANKVKDHCLHTREDQGKHHFDFKVDISCYH